MFILLFNGFITFDTRGILSPPASDVHERLKTNGTAIKFAKEPGVCLFQRWTQNKKIAQSFLSTAKFITKYPSERFYLRWESISKGFLKFCQILRKLINLPHNCDRLQEIRYKTTNIKYNNYSGIPVEKQLLKAIYQVRPESLETFQPSYVSSNVKNENDAIRNRISDFDKRRISQPKNQSTNQLWITEHSW